MFLENVSLINTNWVATLHLNVVRVLSAGITLNALFMIGRIIGITTESQWSNMSFMSILFLPIVAFIMGLGIILVFTLAKYMGVPKDIADVPVGIGTLMLIVFVVVGDPLIWIVRKYYLDIVPIERFKFINLSSIILVQKTE